MAEFASVPSANLPQTPTKVALMNTTQDIPETPAPQYDANGADEVDLFTANIGKTSAGTSSHHKNAMDGMTGIARQLLGIHPVLPRGNIENDIKNHLSCFSVFNNNVYALIEQWNQAREALKKLNEKLDEKDRAFRRERDDKDAALRVNRKLEREIDNLRDELGDANKGWQQAETSLKAAVKQIKELVEKLNITRGDLRKMTQERDLLKVTNAELKREVTFYKERVKSLEHDLRVSNDGETAANDRNTRLSNLLYELEAQKASIEKRKDIAEARTRTVEDTMEYFEKKIGNLEEEIERLQQQLSNKRTKNRGLRSTTYSTESISSDVEEDLVPTLRALNDVTSLGLAEPPSAGLSGDTADPAEEEKLPETGAPPPTEPTPSNNGLVEGVTSTGGENKPEPGENAAATTATDDEKVPEVNTSANNDDEPEQIVSQQ